MQGEPTSQPSCPLQVPLQLSLTSHLSSHIPQTHPSVPSLQAFALTVPSTWGTPSLNLRLLNSYTSFHTQFKRHPLH